MRCSTILAAATMVLLSIVSAQTIPDPASTLACNTCLKEAAIAAVPVCKDIENTEVTATSPATDKHKACWCGLTSNKTWGDSCVKSDKCTAGMKETFAQMIASAASLNAKCDSLSTTSAAAAGNRFLGSSSAKVAAAGAAALAVAGALL